VSYHFPGQVLVIAAGNPEEAIIMEIADFEICSEWEKKLMKAHILE